MLPAIVMMFLLFPAAGIAQHGSRHGSSAGSNPGSAPVEDPNAINLERSVEEEANDDQVAQFQAMTRSTGTALQQAQGLQHLGPNLSDSVELTHKATDLQNSVEEALTDTRKFHQSFTDFQEKTLKALAKKLTKSAASTGKVAQTLSRQLDEVKPDVERLTSAASSLEKELKELQSDQVNLGKQMGIQPHKP